jgi:hypothetical protein
MNSDNSQFQFEPSQKELFWDLAKGMRNIGYLWVATAAIALVFGLADVLLYLKQVHPVNALDIFKNPIQDRDFICLLDNFLQAPFNISIGTYFIKAASFFRKIHQNRGGDIENLLGGLIQLRAAVQIFYALAIIFIGAVWFKIIFF